MTPSEIIHFFKSLNQLFLDVDEFIQQYLQRGEALSTELTHIQTSFEQLVLPQLPIALNVFRSKLLKEQRLLLRNSSIRNPKEAILWQQQIESLLKQYRLLGAGILLQTASIRTQQEQQHLWQQWWKLLPEIPELFQQWLLAKWLWQITVMQKRGLAALVGAMGAGIVGCWMWLWFQWSQPYFTTLQVFAHTRHFEWSQLSEERHSSLSGTFSLKANNEVQVLDVVLGSVSDLFHVSLSLNGNPGSFLDIQQIEFLDSEEQLLNTIQNASRTIMHDVFRTSSLRAIEVYEVDAFVLDALEQLPSSQTLQKELTVVGLSGSHEMQFNGQQLEALQQLQGQIYRSKEAFNDAIKALEASIGWKARSFIRVLSHKMVFQVPVFSEDLQVLSFLSLDLQKVAKIRMHIKLQPVKFF